MATLIALADGTKIDDTEVIGIHDDAASIKVYLPEITAAGGGSADVAPGASVTIETTAAGTVEVCDYKARRVAIVGPWSKLVFRAQSINNDWAVAPAVQRYHISTLQAAAAGTGVPIFGTAAPTGSVDPDYWFEGVGPLGEAVVIPAWIKA